MTNRLIKPSRHLLRSTRIKPRPRVGQLVQWWVQRDRRYGLRWRLLNGAVAVMVLVAVVIPVLQQLYQSNRYQLSAETTKLVGSTNPVLTKQLTYDASKQLYQFNKDAISSSSLPSKIQKSSVGTPANKNSSTYALDVPQDFAKGVTYHDVNSNLSFSLVPNFKAMGGRQVNGRLVFPVDGGSQAVYTLKGNGLKEDIVVPKVSDDTMTFSYTLNLPDTLAAKVIPDSGGAIGIYSADPALFGDISYGSNADQAAVAKARANSPKNYLVFGLPAPVIKTSGSQALGNASARFSLNGNTLSVIAEGLGRLQGPISVDPSVVVTSTSDFQTGGNNEDNIDFSTSGQINRAGLTGASVYASGWSNGTNTITALWRQNVLAYNGYIYSIGGADSGTVARAYVQYASISSGSMGAWHYTHNFTDDGTTFVSGITTARYGAAATVYNGYIYVFGGTTNGSTPLGDVQYAPLNSNGTVGVWNTLSSSYGTSVAALGAAAYNGYMYTYGGTTNSVAPSAAVQYAPINADGTLGSWTTTTSLSGTGRYSFASAVYNGYLYIMGGRDASTVYNDVQYAPLNADGSVGSFTTTNSFSTTRYYLSGFAYNGYLYIMGGNSNQNDIQYAPINANGSVGAWANSIVITTGRQAPGLAAYNGYIYITGGNTSSGVTATSQYAKIDPAGQAQSWRTDSTHTISAARALVCSVAANGYLYAIGGSTNDNASGNVTTVQYSAIGSNGALGTWNTTTALPANRGSAGCATANGVVYVIGGYAAAGTGAGTADGAVLYNSINTNGTLGASWTTNSHSPATDVNSVNTPINPGVFVYNGYLYSVGGDHSDGGNRDGVYYALINSDGSVGTWSAGNDLLYSYLGAAFAQVGKYLYAYGGTDGTTVQSVAEYATINSNGSVSTWTSTTSMPGAIAYSHGTSINGCIYSMGGENSSSVSQNKVYYACPAANGAISAWNTAPTMVTATTDMGVVGVNGILFGVGGFTTAVTGNVAYSFVNNGGTGNLGSWASTSSFTTARTGFGSVAYNGRIYIIGGANSSNTALADVQVATISNTGSLGSWSTAGAPALPAVRYGAGITMYNGYIYVLGGSTTPGTAGGAVYSTYYAKINSDGTLGDGSTSAGTWLSGTTMQGATDASGNAIDLAGVAAYNGYLYSIGGNSCASTCATVTTQYAAINSDGSLGSWATTTALPVARLLGVSFISSGYIYMVGGYNSTPTETSTSLFAPLNPNGTIGSWSYTTAMPYPRASASGGVYNGFVYVMGGYTAAASTYWATTYYAPLNSDGTVGNWQTGSTSFTNGRSRQSSVFASGNAYLLGGADGSTTYATVQYMPLSSIPRIGHYSKLVDVAAAVALTSLTFTGTAPVTPTTASPIMVRVANGSLNTFGSKVASSTLGNTASASCAQYGASNTRYVWVYVTLDDTAGGGFADANIASAVLNDFTINYNQIHPTPNIRLRMGQTLQNGGLSALDTCFP